MTEQSNDILFDVRDGIGRVTFNRPQARNAFTFEMYERLAEICEDANSDRAIKVLIFTGAGDKAFASGTDINQFRAFSDAAGRDRLRGAQRPRARRAGKVPRADHRGDRRRLHRRRRGDRGLLRPAHRHEDRAIRFPDRAHARQLPVDGELRPARGAARSRAREGHHLHGAPRRGAGSACARPARARSSRTSRRCRSGPTSWPRCSRAMRRSRCAPPRRRCAGFSRPLSADEGEDLILMCYMSKDFREGLDAFLTKRTPQWSGE